MNVHNLGCVPKLVPDVRNRRLIAVAIVVAGLLAVTALTHLGQSPPAAATTSPGVTQRVSVHDDGSISDFGGYQGTVSADGRWAAFAAYGGLDPVNKGNQRLDIYVRGLIDGHTYLISGGNSALPGNGSTPVPTPLGPADVKANGDSRMPSISADGRYVAFITGATNIVPNVVSGSTVIVICDRDPKGTGHLDRPRDYSCFLAAESPQPYPQYSLPTFAGRPSLSADASRLTWFDSGSSYGIRADQKITTLQKDQHGALTPKDTRTVTAPLTGNNLAVFGQYNGAKLAADGRHLVGQVSYNPPVCTRACGTPFTTVVDVDLDANDKVTPLAVDKNGRLIPGSPGSSAASGDAHEVAFDFTTASGKQVVYLATREIQPDGGLSPVVTTEVVSKQVSGAEAQGMQPSLSRDGRYLAFVTDDPAVYGGISAPVGVNCFNPESPPPPNSVACQVVMRDLTLDHQRAAARQPMVPAELGSPSVGACGVRSSNTSCAGDGDSVGPTLSGDGGVLVFDSQATNLGPAKGNPNQYTDVFARTLMPGLRIDPIDFGKVQVGQSRTMTTTVHHTGFGPATIVGAGLGGTSPGDFTKGGDTCLKQTLNGEDTCLVTLTYTPTKEGTSDALLVIDTQRNTQIPRQQFSGSIKAAATPVAVVVPPPAGPAFIAVPTTLDFGSRLPLSTTTLPVKVSNAGGSPLHITTTAIVAATPVAGDYTITANGCVGTAVQPAQSCQLSVTFTPHGLVGALPTPDLRTAAIRFDDDAPAGPQLIALTGSMVPPAIQLSPPVVPPGGVIRVTGTGFTPSAKIILHYLNGYPESTIVQSDANGAFSGDLLVFPGNDVGQRTVQAAVDGSAPVVAAVRDLLVVPASLQPPNLVGRR